MHAGWPRLQRVGDLDGVLPALRLHGQRRPERVVGQRRALEELRILLPHLRQALFGRDRRHRLDERIRGELGSNGVDLLAAVGDAVVEIDLDDELALVVVAERERPRRKSDQEAEQEHPDQDGHGRRGGRGDVREERADGF
jgi:hypothetical protein